MTLGCQPKWVHMSKQTTVGVVVVASMLGLSALLSTKGQRAEVAVPVRASDAPPATQPAPVTPPSELATDRPVTPLAEHITEPIMAAAEIRAVDATPSPAITASPVKSAVIPPIIPPAAPAHDAASAESEGDASTGAFAYVAKEGDTLSELAVALRGKDSKANRDSVVNANATLQDNPDHIAIGKIYIASPAAANTPAAASPIAVPPIAPAAKAEAAPRAAASPASAPPVKAAVVEATPAPKPDSELKYTAKPGDTVSNLAGALLGGETKTNRDAIVNANASLRADADHVVAGKTYRIPAPDGLSAATQPVASAAARPTTRPDADDILQTTAPRSLQYIAKAGDTVTSIAIALLGSDTPANRDAILNTNASLKANPDRVVIGQTYWIPAPVADVRQTR